MKNNSDILVGVAFGIAAALIWSGFPVITKLGVTQTLTPFDITAIRFSVAGLLLLPWVWRFGLCGANWRGTAIISVGAGAPYILLAAGGLQFAPAAHFGVITPSSMMLFSALLSWRFLGDKPGSWRLAGMAVVVVGLCLLGWDGLQNHHDKTWVGDAMFVCAGLAWASYTVATRRWPVDPLHAIASVSVVSLLWYVPVYVFFSGDAVLHAPLGEIALQAVFQGVISAIVALWLYTRAVAILGAARGAVFGALVPTFALLLAIPVLHEWPTALQWGGVVVVTLGMLLALGIFAPPVKPNSR